jgi:hypothetical protein
MPSSGILRRVGLVRTDVSEEPGASIVRVTTHNIFSQRALVASYCSPIIFTLMMEAILSSKKSALTRFTRRNIPENTILHYIPIYALTV